MPATATMTIRVSEETKKQLSQLALDTRRSQAFLAGEAVAHYVARERAIVDGVTRGLKDVAAGNLVSHDAAITELQNALETAAGGQRA